MSLKISSKAYVPTNLREFNSDKWVDSLYESVVEGTELPDLPTKPESIQETSAKVERALVLFSRRFANGELAIRWLQQKISTCEKYRNLIQLQIPELLERDKDLLERILKAVDEGQHALFDVRPFDLPSTFCRESLSALYLEALQSPISHEEKKTALKCLASIHLFLPEEKVRQYCALLEIPFLTGKNFSRMLYLFILPETVWDKKEVSSHLYFLNYYAQNEASTFLVPQKKLILKEIAQGSLTDKIDLLAKFVMEQKTWKDCLDSPQERFQVFKQCILWGSDPVALLPHLYELAERNDFNPVEFAYISTILQRVIDEIAPSQLPSLMESLASFLTENKERVPQDLISSLLKRMQEAPSINIPFETATTLLHFAEQQPDLLESALQVEAIQKAQTALKKQELYRKIDDLQRADPELLPQFSLAPQDLESRLCKRAIQVEPLREWTVSSIQSKEVINSNDYWKLLKIMGNLSYQLKWLNDHPCKKSNFSRINVLNGSSKWSQQEWNDFFSSAPRVNSFERVMPSLDHFLLTQNDPVWIKQALSYIPHEFKHRFPLKLLNHLDKVLSDDPDLLMLWRHSPFYIEKIVRSGDEAEILSWLRSKPKKEDLERFLAERKKFKFSAPFLEELKTFKININLLLAFYTDQEISHFPWALYFASSTQIKRQFEKKIKNNLENYGRIPALFLERKYEKEVVKLLSTIPLEPFALFIAEKLLKNPRVDFLQHSDHIHTILRIKNPSLPLLQAFADLLFHPSLTNHQREELRRFYPDFITAIRPFIIDEVALTQAVAATLSIIDEDEFFYKSPEILALDIFDSTQPLFLSPQIIGALSANFIHNRRPQLILPDPTSAVRIRIDSADHQFHLLLIKEFMKVKSEDRVINRARLLMVRALLQRFRKQNGNAEIVRVLEHEVFLNSILLLA